jgi:hypothetical protein
MRQENTLRQSSVLAMLLVVFTLVLFGSAGAGWLQPGGEQKGKKIKLSFRISGGLGYLLNGAGDLDRVRQGVSDLLSLWAENQTGVLTNFNWRRPAMQQDFRASLVIAFSRHFGIGIGSGLLVAPNRGNYSLNETYEWSYPNSSTSYKEQDQTDISRDYRVQAVPIDLDLYAFFPLGMSGKWSLVAHAGVGYYFGRLTHTFTGQEAYDYTAWNQGTSQSTLAFQGTYSSVITETARSQAWGFKAGLGLEMKMASFLSLGAEVLGRLVSFTDWKGEASSDWNSDGSYSYAGETLYNYSYADSDLLKGTFWTVESHDRDSGKRFATMAMLKEEPEVGRDQSAGKSRINLNTLGLSLSLRFFFGSK